jgi:hypothetical protein
VDTNIESIPEEVVSEKLLRDLTRAFSDLIYSCTKQEVKKSSLEKTISFSNPALVEFLTSGNVF